METHWSRVVGGLVLALVAGAGMMWLADQYGVRPQAHNESGIRPDRSHRASNPTGIFNEGSESSKDASTRPMPAMLPGQVAQGETTASAVEESTTSSSSEMTLTPIDYEEALVSALEATYWDLKGANEGGDQLINSSQVQGSGLIGVLESYGGTASTETSSTTSTESTTETTTTSELTWETGTTAEQKIASLKDSLKEQLDYAMDHPAGSVFIMGVGTRPTPFLEVGILHAWAYGKADWVPARVDIGSLPQRGTTLSALLLKLIAEEPSAPMEKRLFALRCLRYLASDYTPHGFMNERHLKPSLPSASVKSIVQDALIGLATDSIPSLPASIKSKALEEVQALNTAG